MGRRLLKMFKLHIGCHRNSIMSRDSQTREFETKEEAIKSYQFSRNFFHSIGYVVWFAKIESPEGKVTELESNSYTG